ncbi:unnamed protein product, partial [Mesorhabditis spiculigera]
MRQFRHDIAALRAVAILAVLGYHFLKNFFPNGYLGVDLFFVISGYLIQRILLESKEQKSYLLIFKFYRKRLKRICPLYFLVMAMTGLSMILAYTAPWAQRYFAKYIFALLFLLNFSMIEDADDYFAEDTSKLPFLHVWSLAVEMQLYLVAPLLFILGQIKIRVTPIAFFTTILISILIHHFYEAILLKSGYMENLLICLKYAGIAWLLCWKWETILRPDCVQKAAIAMNLKYAKSMYNLTGGIFVDDGFWEADTTIWPLFIPVLVGSTLSGPLKNNTGSTTIVVIGNSWATQQSYLILNLFSPESTKSFDVFTMPALCVVLHPEKGKTQFVMKFLREERPDYVFLLLRYNDHAHDLEPFQGDEDPVLKNYLDGLLEASKYTSAIFLEVDQPFKCDHSTADYLNRFVDLLQKGDRLEEANLPFNETEFLESPVQKRLKVVFEKCPKCHPIDISEELIERQRGMLKTYDPDTLMAIVDNDCHLTPTGLSLIETPIKEQVLSVINKLT